jgi:hypothetical protein
MNESNFQKKYSSAPQKIQDFLISEELTEVTKNIVVLAKLNIEQTTGLTEMIGNVLLGQMLPIDFFQEIESNLKVSPSQARIIIELAKKKIFEQFSKELEGYKHQPSEQKIPQKIKIEESTQEQKPLESPKIEKKSVIKEKIEETVPEKISSEQIIPEYSFPEPSKVKVEKPVSKIEELKRVVTPKVSSEQQEKIREKLLAAMQKKNGQPKIVEEMKKIFLKPKRSKETEEKEKKVPRKIKIGELTSSEILSGEGGKFKDEEAFKKTEKEKPYILGAKLKEEKEKKEGPDISKEPIPYKKYQKKNPFGQA